MKKNSTLLIVLAVLLLVGGVGAGTYFAFFRSSDPMKRAEQLAAAGDLRGAQIELRNAVRADPNSAEAHLRLAQTQLQLADPVAAEKEFKAARDLGADRWAVLPQLGQVYMQQGRYQDLLTEIPPEGPKPEIAAKNLMLRAMAQVGMNDFTAANATLALAEKAAPGNVEVLLTASRLALALRDMPLAEKKVDEALKLDPNEVEALLMKGAVLNARGDRAGSLALADKAIALKPASTPARLDRANQLMTAGKDAPAQEDVDQVLKLQPRNAGAIYLNGVLMVRAGRYGDAQTELARLGPVVARFPRALYFQALAASNLGQSEVAIDFANRYLARMPSDLEAVRLVARTELVAQRPERAVNALVKAIGDGQGDAATLDLLGRAYAMMGRGQEAIETFKRASAAAPGDASILTHLASSQMQAGDATAAAAALDRSVEIAPQQPNAAEALVAAALSAGDIDKAEQALARLRAQSGETEQVGILTGLVKLGRLDLEGGRVAFAAALKNFPDSVGAKLNLAKVLLLQGRRAEGEALMREILQKDPANIPTLNTFVAMQVQANQIPAALQVIEAAKAASPKNAQLISVQADLLVRSGDPRRAVALLAALRSSEELPPTLLAALARAQMAAAMNDEAKNTYRDLLKAAPTDLDARRAQVDLLIRLNDIDGARASLREALAQSPGNIGVMSSIVSLELRMTGLEGAAKAAADLRNDPANLPNSSVLRGDLLMQSQRYAEAAQAFQDEFKLRPSTPLALRLANAQVTAGKDDDGTATLRAWQKDDADDADTAQLLSLLDIRAKRLDEAARNLNLVLVKRPSDPIALNNLAWVYQQKNDPRARVMAQRAYLQAPTPETADTLGWIMVGQGDAKTGVTLIQQASTQRPNDMTLKYHLAVALKDTGQKDESVKLLQAITTAPDQFDDKPAARKLLEELTKK